MMTNPINSIKTGIILIHVSSRWIYEFYLLYIVFFFIIAKTDKNKETSYDYESSDKINTSENNNSSRKYYINALIHNCKFYLIWLIF